MHTCYERVTRENAWHVSKLLAGVNNVVTFFSMIKQLFQNCSNNNAATGQQRETIMLTIVDKQKKINGRFLTEKDNLGSIYTVHHM